MTKYKEALLRTGAKFTLTMTDKTCALFEDIGIDAVPPCLKDQHKEVLHDVRKYRTALIEYVTDPENF